jgi:hemolysin activation/secretion protein
MRIDLSLLLLSLLVAGGVTAQTVRPGQERPALPPMEDGRRPTITLPDAPDFEPTPRTPGSVLPPLEEEPTPRLDSGGRVRIDAIDIRGSTALPESVLREIGARYVGRELGLPDLEALRDEVTLAYVDRGFVTSGAVIPDQSVAGRTLVIDVIEGRLEDIRVETDGHYRERHLRARLERSAGPPVNVARLEEALQVLQQDEHIRSVEAALVPGRRPGESILQVRVREREPWRLLLAGDDYVSPSIGTGSGTALASYANLIGVGDVLSAQYQGSSGLDDARAAFATPFTRWDTRIELDVRRTWSEVVEDPFDDLDIEAETETYGVTLAQPVWRSRSVLGELFVTGEWRRSESFLLGEPTSFVPGPDDGVAEIAVLRFGGEGGYRSPSQVLALRSMVSVGLDAFGSTINSGDTPDSRFVAWLLQLQAARRLPWLEAQIVGTVELQLSDQPLLGLEQFSIGGRYTVRGYRENQLVRDQGVAGGVELRIPLPLPAGERFRPTLQIAPFVDAGRSWNADRSSPGDQKLVSVGVGALLGLDDRARLEFYWGHALESVERFGEHSIQDDGIHVGLTVELP